MRSSSLVQPGLSETENPDALSTTVAVINLAHLRHNVRLLKSYAMRAEIMGIVKADAYGHGALRVVKVLQQEGVRHFAVATLPEALELRNAGITDPVLVLAAPLPDHITFYARHNIEATVPSVAVAEAAAAVSKTEGSLTVHLKVDTGMGRIGVQTAEEASAILRILDAPGITVAGIWTHFATADEERDTFAITQLSRFDDLRAQLGKPIPFAHAANSAALLTLPQSFQHYEQAYVRAGIALYGLSSVRELAEPLGLRPVMQFKSRVTHVKTAAPGATISYGRTWAARQPSRIATVGAGYADGYRRLLSNRAGVGIKGQMYPVAGTVCMDMFMVDLGDPKGPASRIQEGDEVILFGEGGPSALDVADWAETIPYEVCTGVSARVPRVYVDASPDD